MKKFLTMIVAATALLCVSGCNKDMDSDIGGSKVPKGAVDLGLSVYWAECNLGVSVPEGYGDYYAWGEVASKSDYSWSTYFDTTDGGSTFTKYAKDKKKVLEAADDVAHVKLGGKWRMPTDDEWKELLNNCTWTWSVKNGMKGYLVVAPNGNNIFLPAAGSREGTTPLHNGGSIGYYWSSSLDEDRSDLARMVYVLSGGVGRAGVDRFCGLSVRPVSE